MIKMKLGGVLARVALVLVLLISVFSGWLLNLAVSSTPVARAAATPLTITNLNSTYSFTQDDSNGKLQGGSVTISPGLSGTTTSDVTLKAELDPSYKYTGHGMSITSGASLTYTPADVTAGTTKNIVVTLQPETTDVGSVHLNLSGSGITSAFTIIGFDTTSIVAGAAGGGAADCNGGALSFISSILNQGLGAAVIQIVTCIIQTAAQSANDLLFDNSSSPLGIVACISQTTPALVERAYAQAPATPACPTGSGAGGSGGTVSTGGLGTLEQELQNKAGPIREVWQISMSIVDVVIVLALLAIAFANILHININIYAAKKALPGLVVGAVGANASLLIIRFLADVCQAVSIWAADIGSTGSIAKMIWFSFPTAIGKAIFSATAVAGPAAIIAPIIFLIAFLYYLFLLIAFLFSLFKRIVILYFLVMVAPIAFIAYGVPGFQQYFTKWWDNFMRYLFLFPIILFGMALTIKLADTLHLAPDQFWSAAGITKIILVFAAGTLVLKLPKLVTKGAIDTASAFKKAIGYAPRMAQGLQDSHSFLYGGGKEKLRARLTRDPAAAMRLHRLARVKSIKYTRRGGKYEKAIGKMKNFRGMAGLFADPAIFQKAYTDRAERDKKMDYIAAVTRNKRLPGKVRGGAAEAELAKKLGSDELSQARSMAEVQDWRDGLGGGHFKAVYAKDAHGNADPDRNLYAIMRRITGGDKAKMEMLRQKFGAITNEDDMNKFLQTRYNDADPLSGGLGVANVWDIHDLMKISAYEKKITELTRQARNPTNYANSADQRGRVDPQGRDIPPPGGTPFGGADGTPPSGGSPGGAPVSVRIAGQSVPLQVDQADFDNHLSQIVEHAQSLKTDITAEEMGALANNLIKASTPDSLDVNELKAALKGVVNPNSPLQANIDAAIDPDDLRQLADSIAVAVGSGSDSDRTVEAIQERLAGHYAQNAVINQHNEDIASRLDERTVQQMINGSLEQTVSQLDQVLGKNFASLNNTLKESGAATKDSLEVFRKMATELHGLRDSIGGRGQYSLRNVINNMGTRLAKNMDIAHSSLGSQLKAAVASEPDVNVTVQAGQEETPASPPPTAVPEPPASEPPVPPAAPPPTS